MIKDLLCWLNHIHVLLYVQLVLSAEASINIYYTEYRYRGNLGVPLDWPCWSGKIKYMYVAIFGGIPQVFNYFAF